MPNQIGHPLVVFLHAPNLQYITVKAAPVNKVKTASYKASLRVQSGAKRSDPRELTAEALRRRQARPGATPREGCALPEYGKTYKRRAKKWREIVILIEKIAFNFNFC